jgi:hypothetical protein
MRVEIALQLIVIERAKLVNRPLRAISKRLAVISLKAVEERASLVRGAIGDAANVCVPFNQAAADEEQKAPFDYTPANQKLSIPKRHIRMEALGTIGVPRVDNEIIKVQESLEVIAGWISLNEDGERTHAGFESAVERRNIACPIGHDAGTHISRSPFASW